MFKKIIEQPSSPLAWMVENVELGSSESHYKTHQIERPNI